MIISAGSPTAVSIWATLIPIAFSSARAFLTFSSAAPSPSRSVATENKVIGSFTIWASTAERRTACIERAVPSVQMKKPLRSRLERAIITEQGASTATLCTIPASKNEWNSPRQRDGSPSIMRL